MQPEFYEGLWEKEWRDEVGCPGAGYRTRHRLILRCYGSVYHAGARVLDVGCGNGTLLCAIRSRHPDAGGLVGTDVAQAALDAARKALPEAEFVRHDLQEAPLSREGSFDIVTCCEVLEHMADFESALRHINQALRPGGHLILSVPHSMRFWGPHDEAVHHLRRFEPDELCEVLESLGMTVDSAFTWGTLVYRAYYALILNRMSPQATWRRKSRLIRFLHSILYHAFRVDDLLTGLRGGRMLFVVARKPDPDGLMTV